MSETAEGAVQGLAKSLERMHEREEHVVREPVWPSGKALGRQADDGWFESGPASALLSLEKLWFVDTACVAALPLTINETLKQTLVAAALLNAEIILVVTV